MTKHNSHYLHRIKGFTTLVSTLLLVFSSTAGAQNGATNHDYEAEETGAYAYVRALDGKATLFPHDESEREEVEQNLPLLTGDRLSVASRSRLELILSDYNVLRIDSETEVSLDSLAFAPGTEDKETLVNLLEGNLQLVVFEDTLGEKPPVIRTGNAEIFLHEKGTYRVSADHSTWTRVVVRDGFAEILTERGSSILRGGEEAVLEGSAYPSTRIATASRRDGLERWGEDLEAAANYDDTLEHVDEELRYAAAPLRKHGKWISVEGRSAWRPHYSGDWRPYWQGRWSYTPTGMTWVSYEPWGWVPYHYGSWDYSRSFGWVWFPGRRFAPAHVHWYWGKDYVAWFPSGYYHRYYSTRYGRDWGRYRGVYGYAGGSWGNFDAWNFCDTRYLGSRRQNGYVQTGRNLRRTTGWDEVPRGIITTDTVGLTPDRWRDHDKVDEVLRRDRRGPRAGSGRRELPDVTSLVAREPSLGPEVVDRVLTDEIPNRRFPTDRLEDDKERREAKPRVLDARSGGPLRSPPRDTIPSSRPGVESDKDGLSNRPSVLRDRAPRDTVRGGTVRGDTVRGDRARGDRTSSDKGESLEDRGRSRDRVAPRRPVATRPRGDDAIERKPQERVRSNSGLDNRGQVLRPRSVEPKEPAPRRAAPREPERRRPNTVRPRTPVRRDSSDDKREAKPRQRPRLETPPARRSPTRVQQRPRAEEPKRERGLSNATPATPRQGSASRPRSTEKPRRTERPRSVQPERRTRRPSSQARPAPRRAPEQVRPRSSSPPRRQSSPPRRREADKPRETQRTTSPPRRSRRQSETRSAPPPKRERRTESVRSSQPKRSSGSTSSRNSSRQRRESPPPKRREAPKKDKEDS